MSIERKGIKKIVELFNCKELGMKVGNKDLSECEDVNFILTFLLDMVRPHYPYF